MKGPFQEWFFPHNSNSMENWFLCNSIVGDCITTKLCTCHNSIAVVPCAEFHRNHFTATWMTVKLNFHWIWVTMGKVIHVISPWPRTLYEWMDKGVCCVYINVIQNLHKLCHINVEKMIQDVHTSIFLTNGAYHQVAIVGTTILAPYHSVKSLQLVWR